MRQRKILVAGPLLLALAACGGAPSIDSRAALMAACETSQGIGWNKREYGERYCECWADQAKEVLSSENYQTLVEAAQAEVKAADKADREKVIRQNTEIYSTVSSAAKSCAKAGG